MFLKSNLRFIKRMTRVSISQINIWMLGKSIQNQVRITMESVTCTLTGFSTWESPTKSKKHKFHWEEQHLTPTKLNSWNLLLTRPLAQNSETTISDLTWVRDVKSTGPPRAQTKVIMKWKEQLLAAPCQVRGGTSPTRERWFWRRSFRFQKTSKIITIIREYSQISKIMLEGRRSWFLEQIRCRLNQVVSTIDINKTFQITWEFLTIQIIEMPFINNSTEILTPWFKLSQSTRESSPLMQKPKTERDHWRTTDSEMHQK